MKRDDTVVVVAVNTGTSAIDVPITINGGTAPASMSTWVTTDSQDMEPSDDAPITDGIFTASLPATSVKTFRGQ